mmetsp:Transcript_37884/g.86684  ORF Transcript_37884/g.86684 Transcript_37884/m.86684 type:complete len:94 (+) Transcript_37884:593-874(+)
MAFLSLCLPALAAVLLNTINNVTGASDDTTKRQRLLAADLAHFRQPDGTLRTLCIGLSVPLIHGDVAALDRVTLLDLVKNWCSDRCITALSRV